NLISSIGGFVMAIGVATTLLDFIFHFRAGRKAPVNPWNADTLEWATATPPTSYNFFSLPEVTSRHPMWERPELPQTIAAGTHSLTQIEHGNRETWGSEAVSGKLRERIHLPGNSWLPFFSALTIAFMCIFLLSKIYWPALAAALLSLVLLFRWSWINGAHPRVVPTAYTAAGEPPLHSRSFGGPGVWGVGVTLLADAALYASLLCGWLYLWTVAPLWQRPEDPPGAMLPLMLSGLLSLGVVWIYRRLIARLRRAQPVALLKLLSVAAVLGGAHWLLLLRQ